MLVDVMNPTGHRVEVIFFVRNMSPTRGSGGAADRYKIG